MLSATRPPACPCGHCTGKLASAILNAGATMGRVYWRLMAGCFPACIAIVHIREGATASSQISGAANAQVVREADGYQAHLVSPEFGLRRLVDETIGMVLEPVNVCVRRVHQVLLDAARCWSCPARCVLFSSNS